MQYYQFLIHCHRPYISKHHIQPQPPQGPGPGHARKMCLDSAVSIVKVLTMYEHRYGFRRANVQMVSYVFSAALILIFVTVPSGKGTQDTDLVKHLSTCFWALDEMGACFENAKRTSTFLGTLQQQWHRRRREFAHRNLKRGPQSSTEPSRDPKRPRNTAGFQGWSEFDSTYSTMIEGTPAPHEVHEFSTFADGASDLVDFMDPELCNILLSEGIPRSLV